MKQSMDGCVITYHSILYGRVPFSLLSVLWFLECANSLIGIALWCADDGSMTSALVRSTGWLVSKVCSVRANAVISPFFRTHWCSTSWCLRVRPVCPMYILGHPLQGMEYRTSFSCCSGTGSLGCTSMWRKVLSGWKTTLMSSCVRIRLTALDRPLMYGRATVILVH